MGDPESKTTWPPKANGPFTGPFAFGGLGPMRTTVVVSRMQFSDRSRGLLLTPFYDLMCTRSYPDLSQEFAFSIGGEFKPGSMTRPHLQALARELGMQPQFFLRQAAGLAEKRWHPSSFTSSSQQPRRRLRASRVEPVPRHPGGSVGCAHTDSGRQLCRGNFWVSGRPGLVAAR